MLLYLDDRADRETVIRGLKERFPQLEISSSGPVFIEVNVKGVDKGKALTRFCRMQGIPAEESIAFGDAENDLPLLTRFENSVAVANATPVAANAARWHIGRADEDAVADAIFEIARATSMGEMPSFMRG